MSYQSIAVPLSPTIYGDTTFVGAVSMPAGSITDAAINSNAAIGAAKTVGRKQPSANQAIGTAVVAATTVLYTCSAAGSAAIGAVYTGILGAIATDVSRTITIDIKKVASGGSPTTILTATISITNGATLYAITTTIPSVTTMAAGDSLIAYVTVAGGSGNQAQGLLLQVQIDEKGT